MPALPCAWIKSPLRGLRNRAGPPPWRCHAPLCGDGASTATAPPSTKPSTTCRTTSSPMASLVCLILVSLVHRTHPHPSSPRALHFSTDQRQKVVQDRADAAEAQRQADIKARTDQAVAAKEAREAAAASAAAARASEHDKASEAAAAAAAVPAAAQAAVKEAVAEAEIAPAVTEPTHTGSAARQTLETAAAKVVDSAAAAPAAAVDAAAAGSARAVHATITITVDDNNETQLVVYEGQTAEEAVVEYCQANAADDTAGCIRQLLPVVIDKLAEQ